MPFGGSSAHLRRFAQAPLPAAPTRAPRARGRCGSQRRFANWACYPIRRGQQFCALGCGGRSSTTDAQAALPGLESRPPHQPARILANVCFEALSPASELIHTPNSGYRCQLCDLMTDHKRTSARRLRSSPFPCIVHAYSVRFSTFFQRSIAVSIHVWKVDSSACKFTRPMTNSSTFSLLSAVCSPAYMQSSCSSFSRNTLATDPFPVTRTSTEASA